MTDLSYPGDLGQGRRWTFSYENLVDRLFFLLCATGSLVFFEPSPFDFLLIPTILAWLGTKLTLHRALLPFMAIMAFWLVGGYLSLIPYWNEADPVAYMFYSVALTVCGIFFALFAAQRTTRRVDFLLVAYTISCVIAAIIACATWYSGFGNDGEWIKDGRAMAPFKDPNVLGTYLVPGVIYLVQRLVLRRWSWLWLVAPSLALVVAALFLSFSRGSWGAAIISLVMMIGFLFFTADSARLRANIIAVTAGVVAMAGVALVGALSVPSVKEFFFQRAAVSQDYDGAPNGRFGNQIRSLPMLMEMPNGMGPLRFRLTFGLEPHSSYVNGFASSGWIGGFSFIALTLTTVFVGFKLCLTRHPWRRQAQVLFPAIFVFFVQGFQIDLDHWRMFYEILGALWGLHAARERWLTLGEPEDGPIS